MMELIAIVALSICAMVITIAVRIYKECPGINKNAESD